MKKSHLTIDGNEAVARVAHKISEVIAMYPITPSYSMTELSAIYPTNGENNTFVTVQDHME